MWNEINPASSRAKRILQRSYFTRNSVFHKSQRDLFRCSAAIAAEQKARATYDNILRLVDDPDVCDAIKFLRAREIVHYQRFADALGIAQDNMNSQNFYGYNPAFDKVREK